MVFVWIGLLMILVGGILIWFGRSSSTRGFAGQWTPRGFVRWVGSVAIGLGLFVLIKWAIGSAPRWESVRSTGCGLLLAYFIVGIVYKVGAQLVDR